MRLLIACTSSARGGAEEYIIKIALAAIKRGWDVHAGFPDIPSLATVREDLVRCGVSCHSLDILDDSLEKRGLWGELKRFFRMLRLIKNVKPDCVHFTLPWLTRGHGPLLACGFLAVPTMVVFQLAPWILPLGRITRALRLFAWKRGQKWISPSRQNRQVIAESFQIDESAIGLIYNSVVPSNVTAAELTYLRKQLRDELSLPEEAILVISVGRLHEQKGYDVLLKSASQVLAAHPNVFFLWVGDGPMRDALLNDISREGLARRILLPGHRNDVSDLMQASDLFVLASRYEGGGPPFAVMEASAHLLPFVASTSTNALETFVDEEECLMFETDNQEELTEKLCWALGHLDEMKEKAANAYVKLLQHTEDDMTKQTLDVLGGMVKCS